ncbi:hypothetical protein L1I30_09675 [Gillisia sp. M10.2A]|uniref:Uncharacterized protein n=1 Tax=Gillisia lutea TaxID=2909668 RepID=A0ABS9EIB6_9FLAO|nr:hypothetical protein [Gillisia lutea]MCF4101934.1 hypothetical protein [Gillisia lutea]
MKKLSLLLLAAVFSLSIYSCRETTEEKTEDAVEEMGTDIENAAEEAGDEVEAAADNAGNEIEEEVDGTDDVNGDDDM